jgi:hypothetical protein
MTKVSVQIAEKISLSLPLKCYHGKPLFFKVVGAVMKRKIDPPCLVCGEHPKGSCIRCRAEKLQTPIYFLGIRPASWFVLILGIIIAAVFLRA